MGTGPTFTRSHDMDRAQVEELLYWALKTECGGAM
jgi:hypothetical protein